MLRLFDRSWLRPRRTKNRETHLDVCTNCKSLAGTPRRFDVPAHLVRIESSDGSERVTPGEQAFVCLHCHSQWNWSTVGAWILTLPVDEPATDDRSEAHWWTRVSEIVMQRQQQPGSRPSWLPHIGLRKSHTSKDSEQDSR